jgi:hypothetical protein
MNTITATNYKGRVWTCDRHHAKIEAMIAEGKTAEAMALVDVLNPKKSRGICRECRRLWEETPPMNR